MADDADIANDYWDKVLGAQIASIKPMTGESLSECESCGNDIPKERQKAVDACRTCFECAQVRYLMNRGPRRG